MRRRLFPRAHYHEPNSSDECDATEDRRNWHGSVLLMRDVHRTQIRIMFSIGVMKSTEREPGNAHNNQQDSYKSCCLQSVFTPLSGLNRVPAV
jgi:hypothetical protein